MSEQKPVVPDFDPYQKLVIALIAILQFTVVLDFMVMSPLSDFLIKDLQITPAQFGLVVSSYAFSAGISGILAAGFADRFDRKRLLLFFYVGFVIGTLLCGIARTYETLLFARIITGLFGGVIGAVGMAIITDLFEINQRGRVMGFVQMAFAGSQVLGIPISLVIANEWNWNAPFLMIVGLSILLGLAIVVKMKPVDKHLALPRTNVLQHMWNTLKTKRYQTGFIATALLPIGAFMLMPFGSVFAVNNLGVDPKILFIVFMATGISSIVIMPVIGKMSDKYDKMKIFAYGSIWAMIMVVIYTRQSVIPLWMVVALNIMMFMGIMSRIVPATTLISAIPEMKDRGAFMAINGSLQQLAGGIASVIAGLIVSQPAAGTPLRNFETLGIVVSVLIAVTIYGIYRVDLLVKPQVPESPKAEAKAA